MRFVKIITALALLIGLLACGGMQNDLVPSGDDKRPKGNAGETGALPGQKIADLTLPNTDGGQSNVYDTLKSFKGSVFYFTMWCPVCESHMEIMRSSFVAQYPQVEFFAVDYVSGSVAQALAAQNASGFGGSAFVVLSDFDGRLTNALQGTMATTVVVDNTGTILMNEDFKDGSRLKTALDNLP